MIYQHKLAVGLSSLMLALSLGACSVSSTHESSVEVSSSVETEADEEELEGDSQDTESQDAYVNSYFGFRYELPEGMTFLNDDELTAKAEEGGMGIDAEQLEAGERSLATYAVNSDESEKVYAFITYLGEGSEMTTEEFASQMTAATEEKVNAITDYEASVTTSEVEIGEVSFPCDITEVTDGVESNCEMAMYTVQGEYGFTFVFSAETQDDVSALLEHLSLYEE